VKTRQKLRRGLILVSFLLFPLTMFYLSPAMIFKGARMGVVSGSFLLFALLFVSALFLGRAFCAWLCPVSGLGQVCMSINGLPARGGRYDWIKYLLWVPWLGAVAAVAVSHGGYHRVDPIFGTVHGVSISEPVLYIFYYIVLGLIVGLSLGAGRMAFCHYICWMAPFMVLGNKAGRFLRLPSLCLTVQPEKCSACGLCSQNCIMSLAVMVKVQRGDMADSECILCGTCVDSCPEQAISPGFGQDRRRA
jgi:polyferredoxin